MGNLRGVVVIVLLWLSAATHMVRAAEPNDPNALEPPEPKTKAAVIVCKGIIDDGLYRSIQRRSQLAIENGAEYLIFEIQTYGGLLQSADDISKYLILELGKKVRTVAYITSEAISAGAMISVSCQDIIMLDNTTIGDCAPIALGGQLEGVEREKAESFTRAAFVRAAQANNYPEALLKAMVSMRIEVYRVRNLATDEYEFFEAENLPDDPNRYDLDDKQLVVGDSEILTLTASEAAEYGIARTVVDSLDEALAFLARRDSVEFETEPTVHETTWSEEMVRWLNSPAVMSVLVMVGLLGIYIELNTPGLGLPGLVGVICFAIIIGSKYLWGLANWIEVAIFLLGVVLLMIELFVIPGFGIAGILGIVCIIAGLLGMLIKNAPDELPIPAGPDDWTTLASGALGIGIGFVGFVVLAILFARYMPRISFLSGLILAPSQTSATMAADLPESPQTARYAAKPGDVGSVTMKLRPVGRARFDDTIIDVVAEGDFIDSGEQVVITGVHGNRVLVKRLNDGTEA